MQFNSNNIRNIRNVNPMTPKQKNFIKNIIIAAVVLIFLIWLAVSSLYTVSDKQEAVVTTFGKYTATVGAGIHFKLPFGIQNATLVNVNVSLKQEIGYNPVTLESIPTESKMITGDLNIVNVDFYLEYRISDPVKYLYSSESPDDILKNITQSKIRDIISSCNVDDVLTTGKADIQAKIKALIVDALENYDIGLQLTDIKIQDSEPPTDEVSAAFKSVETAKQDRETAINQAKAYENANIPKAEAEADQLTQNAEFLKQNRINDATKQVAMFEAVYNQYILNKTITKQRMYYEMIEQVLPGVKVYINAGATDTSVILPLDSFSGGAANSANNTNNINNTNSTNNAQGK